MQHMTRKSAIGLSDEVFQNVKSTDNGSPTVPLIRIIDNGEVRVVRADAELPWEATEAQKLAAYRRKSMPIRVTSFEL
jgi:hypothetical protein